MDKAPDAYRTISEVGDDLDIAQHVLRFWETRFAQIKPLKRGGGRRYYRPDDVELLKGIRHLLYQEGYTIKGVQRILKEQGARAVQDVGRAGRLVAELPREASAVPNAPSAVEPASTFVEPAAVPASFSAMRRTEPASGEGPLPNFPAQWGASRSSNVEDVLETKIAAVPEPVFESALVPDLAAREEPKLLFDLPPMPAKESQVSFTRGGLEGRESRFNPVASPDRGRHVEPDVEPAQTSVSPERPISSEPIGRADARRQHLLSALGELEQARAAIGRVLALR
ncbi:HTH_MlrA-like_sg2 domain containing protein [Rhabdaerophilaceae bacterium]